jgi:benzylsuccinate CoA-transferase BbsE subunit
MALPNQDALAGIRVIDLSSRFSFYTAKLFADMGADVVLIEPPGGCALRREAPFLGDRIDDALGIPFNFYNTGKRGMILNLSSPRDAETFRSLARHADLIIEDGPPGALQQLDLGLERLAEQNPKLVMTSLTPFGQTGPYAQLQATDLTLLALGGLLNMMGYPDGPPTQTYGNQAIAMGCMFAAVGSMIALTAAQADGVGQRVDVSIQESVTMATENTAQFYDLAGVTRKRFAGEQRHAGTGVFACSDGFIYLFAGGMAGARFWANLVTWLRDENVAGHEELEGARWLDISFMDGPEAKAIFNRIFPSFCARWKKDDIYHEAQRRQIPLSPINDARDVFNNAQLQARGMFVGVPHEVFGAEITMPNVPFSMSASPGRVRHRAPLPGEHQDSVPADWQRAAVQEPDIGADR